MIAVGNGIGVGFSRGNIPWYKQLKADATNPNLALQFSRQRYAVNGASKPFSAVLTLTRASTKWVYNSSGLLTSVGANLPAYDYDPVTGEAKGILVEESRVNKTTYSVPTTGQWSATNSTTSYDNDTSPAGTQTAALNTAQAATAVSYCHGPGTVSYVSGTTYTLSYFVKAGTSNRVQLTGASTVFGFSQYANFLLSGTGSVTASASCSAGILQLANGWYRVWITVAASATIAGHNGAAIRIISGSEGRVPSLTFSGTESFYIWGAQVEVGSFPTSYIPTTSAAVTRAADAIVWTGFGANCANLSEGTLFLHYAQLGLNTGGGFTVSIGADNTHYFGLGYQTASTLDGNAYYKNGASVATTVGPGGAAIARTFLKDAVKYSVAGNAIKRARDSLLGNAYSPVTSLGSMPNLRIGTSEFAPTVSRNCWIKEIRYYNFAVSDAELQRITTL